MSDMFEKYGDSTQANYHLNRACAEGMLEDVKYLVNEKKADVHWNDENAIRCACVFGHLDVVRYLLTSPDIKTKPDLEVTEGDRNSLTSLGFACKGGHVDIVKYLLTSPDLEKHSNVRVNDDHPFRVSVFEKQIAVLQYLIFDYNLEKTKTINNYIASNKKYFPDLLEKVENMFKIRELNQKLESELAPNQTTSETNAKKVKL